MIFLITIPSRVSIDPAGRSRRAASQNEILRSMFDDLLAANARYAQSFALAGLQPRAAKRFALVTCIDSRIEPLASLGLRAGDAKILRNAGGRATDDVVRSLAIAVALLGVERIAVMHHTGCAMAGKTDAELRTAMATAGTAGTHETAGVWLGGMPDKRAALDADVAAIRNSRLIPPTVVVAGWMYDVETGAITPTVS
jgi:carbonic anhydrase